MRLLFGITLERGRRAEEPADEEPVLQGDVFSVAERAEPVVDFDQVAGSPPDPTYGVGFGKKLPQ